MTNLLPKTAKVIIRREYYMRLIIVSLFLSGIVLLIASFLLIPSYFLTHLKGVSGQGQIEIIEGVVALHEKDNVEQQLLETRQKLNIISREKRSNLVEIIGSVLEEKSSLISINSFFWDNGELGIRGTAQTRDGLVVFVDRLEQASLFVNVDLPVSNLAASRDINFSLTMDIIEL